MLTKTKRTLLFLFGCILTRICLVFLAKNSPTKYLPILGGLALLPAIGFFIIFITNSRQTGLETFGEKIWWNRLRPIHALLYLLFAIFAFSKKSFSWIFLAIDVILGLTAWLLHI